MSQSVMFWTMTHLPLEGVEVMCYVMSGRYFHWRGISVSFAPSAPTTLPFPPIKAGPRVGKEGG